MSKAKPRKPVEPVKPTQRTTRKFNAPADFDDTRTKGIHAEACATVKLHSLSLAGISAAVVDYDSIRTWMDWVDHETCDCYFRYEATYDNQDYDKEMAEYTEKLKKYPTKLALYKELLADYSLDKNLKIRKKADKLLKHSEKLKAEAARLVASLEVGETP